MCSGQRRCSGSKAEMRSLDAQGGVVGEPPRGAVKMLAERGPMMRLSGNAGSRPCSISRCFCTPLNLGLPVVADEPSPTGVASASEPPALT